MLPGLQINVVNYKTGKPQLFNYKGKRFSDCSNLNLDLRDHPAQQVITRFPLLTEKGDIVDNLPLTSYLCGLYYNSLELNS